MKSRNGGIAKQAVPFAGCTLIFDLTVKFRWITQSTTTIITLHHTWSAMDYLNSQKAHLKIENFD